MIKIFKTKLKNVLLIKPTFFKDFRGEFLEIFNNKLYTTEIFRKIGTKIEFVEDDISISSKNVLRGIHGDSETWKLISCLYGKVYVVIVNCDETSKKFGKWQSFVLSDINKHQILVPPKYGTSYLILSDKAIVHYKQSKYYDPKRQFTYLWNDPRFKIKWPTKHPILSERDKLGMSKD
jgi:dTDP-4-dehydrorhamnose 3,5-epimerase